MPATIGEITVPRVSPHLLACRRALRPYRGREVLVGLSGGPDSLALLAACAAEGVSAEALVVDHRLQPGSADVARTAVAEAARMGMSAQVRPVEVPGGQNMEAAARRVRYAALVEAAAGRPVLVGHTGDDQAETLVLTALRGNPAGMRAVSGQVHRPLLGVRRADTVGACRELGLRPWSDPHNDDPAFRRVAVRTRVMALLAEITGADPVVPLAAGADKLAEDDALLDELAGGPTDDCAELAAQPTALRRRRITAWLHARGGAVNAATVAAVEALCVDWRGQGGVAVGGVGGARLEVRRVGGKLTLIPKASD